MVNLMFPVPFHLAFEETKHFLLLLFFVVVVFLFNANINNVISEKWGVS